MIEDLKALLKKYRDFESKSRSEYQKDWDRQEYEFGYGSRMRADAYKAVILDLEALISNSGANSESV